MNILLIGDIHGDIDSLGYAKELMHKYACEAVVQLGDFGLYRMGYSDEFTHQAFNMFKDTGALYVLPGNHENYGVLKEKGWLDRRSRVMLPRRAGYYPPTGCRFKLGDTWCLA